MKSPIERYQAALAAKLLEPDPQQAHVMTVFERLYQALVTQAQQPCWRRWLQRPAPIRGLYLWGGVGIGKTMLMDMFFQSLPIGAKRRDHFHYFMRRLQAQLKAAQGQRNPLEHIANEIAQDTRILCFDEFIVKDVADAMVLSTLVAELFKRQVILVATSNVAPDDLYRGGLQYDRFKPVIDLIGQHCEVIHVPTTRDFRLAHHLKAGMYYTPVNDTTTQAMQQHYQRIVISEIAWHTHIEVAQRLISVIGVSLSTVWFSFKNIVDIPRSTHDYLELAKRYQVVFISEVTQINKQQDNLIRNFIHLIDVLYDERVKLVLQSAVPIEEIYPQGRMAVEFQRTKSRLYEMQTNAYLQWPHGREDKPQVTPIYPIE